MTRTETQPPTQPRALPALAPGDSAAYLSRLGVPAPAAPTLGALASLHRAHLLAVPFENLDIGLGRPIRLDGAALTRKILGEGRGGYCYELNGLFAALLDSLGYAAALASARVAPAGGGRADAAFDHLALIVTSPLLSEPQLADVGFGDAFMEPLPLRDGVSRHEGGKCVGLVRDGEGDGDGWAYREDTGRGWETQYVLSTVPRVMADFASRNEWQQTSADSHFTRKRVVSLATASGRVTLTMSGGRPRLVTTTDQVRTERDLEVGEVGPLLAERFGIVLGEADAQRLAELP